jgi:ribosomal-protein-alanine N-acetyltransferase
MDDAAPGTTAWPGRIPELTTGRLRLRAPRPRDAAALLDILGDPEVTRYLNVATFTTLADAQAALERLQQRFTARDTIRWAIELVESGEAIGTVGLLRFDPEHRHAEVGYEIGRRWWGRGLAPEVLQKLGFVEEGLRRDYLQFRGRFHTFRWFSLLATDEAAAALR